MIQRPENLRESPSQTAGPYVHIGCTPSVAGLSNSREDFGAIMKTGPVQGQEITITGSVFDGTGTPLCDAMIEIWQADAAGLFRASQETRGAPDPHFTGWGRCASEPDTGRFAFDTVKPGPVPYSNGRMQAPHVTVWIVARGINIALQTRLYFEDEAAANAVDPILTQIEDQSRIPTLLATTTSTGHYRFDIHLQGPHETIFFDI